MQDLHRFTLAQARILSGPIVYGLLDGDTLFYIGATTNPDGRFYLYGSPRTRKRRIKNLHLLRHLERTKDGVHVVVLIDRPSDLAAAEREAIIRYSSQLANITHNPYKLPTGINLKARPSERPQCPACDKPIERYRNRFCNACTGKLRYRVKARSSALALAALAHK